MPGTNLRGEHGKELFPRLRNHLGLFEQEQPEQSPAPTKTIGIVSGQRSMRKETAAKATIRIATAATSIGLMARVSDPTRV